MRPATPVICQFIDAHKDAFGVAPICRALSAHGVPIAPRTYWAHRSRPPSRRALWDMTVTEVLPGSTRAMSGAAVRRSRCTGA